MDNWLALFDGQTRYFLDINDSTMTADVLRFRGREALSEPFRWDIEFTSGQANIPPEQVLMKFPAGAAGIHPAVRRISEPVRAGGGGAGSASARAGRAGL